MMKQHDAHPNLEADGHLIYLACSPEDLIAVEMDAWTRGFSKAGMVETSAEPASITDIEQAAKMACDQALKVYIPLDLDRFRDVFTRAWCAGYCTALRRRDHLQRQHSTGPDDSTH
jgi:hypothetical protein